MANGTERVERKLAAIFCADVAGYSRLMGSDEIRTLHNLTAHRAIMDGLIAQHGGRIANTAGDSILAEFPSVVDAVECAVAVQDQLREANAEVADDRALRFRIGIHVGDVMVRGADLLGDGVNVAARVQSLADPGGVWISGRAHDEIEGKIDRSFEDRGEQQLKNISRPVRVYAVVGNAPSRREPKALPLPDKPSIAVLPFTNMSGDPEQDYFADGIVEDIITALAKERGFFVSARNSSFTYKGRSVDVKQVARELGVRYVLEGSVRKAANRVRITGQLIEAETGSHLWADRYDAVLEDVFELQDRVTESVVAALHPTLRGAESERAARKRPEDLTAYDLYLRALPDANSIAPDRLERALDLLDQAVSIDTEFAQAHALAALCYVWQRANLLRQRPDAQPRCQHHLERALELGPTDATVLATAGIAAVYLAREHDLGLELTERSVTLNPNSAMGWATRGWVQYFGGEPLEPTIESFEKAKRLSPLDPMSWYFHGGMGQAYASAGRHEDAVSWSERSRRENRSWTAVWRSLAGSYARLGRLDEARHAVSKILETTPEFTITRWRELTPLRAGERRDYFLEGLRLAGLPE